jgi:site-specific DNA-methyltransferase (adenine-specific)
MTYPNVLYSSASDDWRTPDDFFQECVNLFGGFDLDAAASAENAKAERYFTVEDNALNRDWDAENVWLNPPYGREMMNWVEKAIKEFESGRSRQIVMLVPSKTATKWFWRVFEHDKTTTFFIKGRLRFGQAKKSAPFGSVVFVLSHTPVL